MKNGHERVESPTSRRGFVRRCLGTGAVLAATQPGHMLAASAANAPLPLATVPPEIAECERILSRTDQMDVLGRPRSWSVVEQGFHPFSPERIAIMRSGGEGWFRDGKFGQRCDRRLRQSLDEQIDLAVKKTIELERRLSPNYDFGKWNPLPDSKRESILWIMDVMTDYYGVRSQFEPWVLGLVVRELLGSSAMTDFALAHQFQHADGEVAVDCPPVDWWLFLYPGGVDLASLDDNKPIYAVFAHVARDRHYGESGCAMLPTWGLVGRVMHAISEDGVAAFARMGRTEAARYLNPIVARLLDGL
jgi:hypothetical protein